MPKGYNALRGIKVNHLEAGICPEHGNWLTYEKCNCYPEQTALFFAAEQTKTRDWEADAEAVHKLLTFTTPDVPHAVEEAKSQYECEMCNEGVMDLGYGTPFDKQPCTCCNGNWQDCQNCKPEGTGNDTADLLASMR